MSEEIKIGYKVVRVSTYNGDETYLSCIFRDMRANVTYYTDRYSEPGELNGPLAVFNSLSAARAFARIYWMERVFECEYVPSSHNELWYTGTFSETILAPHRICEYPDGTRFASKVRLVRKCTDE